MTSNTTIQAVRSLLPMRSVTDLEARKLAELQAKRAHELFGITEPPVDVGVIIDLPRVEVVVDIMPPTHSGHTAFERGKWVIHVNRLESTNRRRFTLAHEFKHIIDHQLRSVLYQDLPMRSSEDRVEDICDYFAGCFLVPGPWLKSLWYGGQQNIRELARLFRVSEACMTVRLAQTGLLETGYRYSDSTVHAYFRRASSAPATCFLSA